MLLSGKILDPSFKGLGIESFMQPRGLSNGSLGTLRKIAWSLKLTQHRKSTLIKKEKHRVLKRGIESEYKLIK